MRVWQSLMASPHSTSQTDKYHLLYSYYWTRNLLISNISEFKHDRLNFVECILFFIKEFGVNAVDTTGAGDVFHAGFIYGLLRNWEVTDILRFANAVAALKCRAFGGRKGISSLEEVRKFLDPA